MALQRKQWTSTELIKLDTLYQGGATSLQIANELDRTDVGVQFQIKAISAAGGIAAYIQQRSVPKKKKQLPLRKPLGYAEGNGYPTGIAVAFRLAQDDYNTLIRAANGSDPPMTLAGYCRAVMLDHIAETKKPKE